MKIKLLLIVVLALGLNTTNAQYTKLLDFAGVSNGSDPYGSLIAIGGDLYGMTRDGGTNNMGVIFKINPDGTGYTKLLDFAGISNGSAPYGDLISDGTFLYGTTYQGGTGNVGTIFKIMPDGTGYTKIYDFDIAGGANGINPRGSLFYDGTFLYGTAQGGGANSMGVLFKLMPDGTGYTKLLDFAGVTNGNAPYGSLISDGTFLYGMTYQGGTASRGVIFKIMPDGTGLTKLKDFANSPEARSPYGSLLMLGNTLYGMTYLGGTNNMGAIFKIQTDGTGYAKLLDFAGTTNGSYPTGSLVSDGTFLYGMASAGGTNDMGVLFKLMPDGTGYTKLMDFAGATNGSLPAASLIYDGGYVYGMTPNGGTTDMGTIFRYQVATVITIPTAPGNLTATAISSSQINLTWTDNSTDEFGFIIERSADSSIFNIIDTVSANIVTLSDTGLTASTKYFYRVNAYNSAGNSAYSNIAVATTLGEDTTGINDINTNSSIQIFPNPATGVFQIQLTESNHSQYSVEIFNVLGEKVFSGVNLINQALTKINFSTAEKGIYFVKVFSETNISTQMLIIQ